MYFIWISSVFLMMPSLSLGPRAGATLRLAVVSRWPWSPSCFSRVVGSRDPCVPALLLCTTLRIWIHLVSLILGFWGITSLVSDILIFRLPVRKSLWTGWKETPTEPQDVRWVRALASEFVPWLFLRSDPAAWWYFFPGAKLFRTQINRLIGQLTHLAE